MSNGWEDALSIPRCHVHSSSWNSLCQETRQAHSLLPHPPTTREKRLKNRIFLYCRLCLFAYAGLNTEVSSERWSLVPMKSYVFCCSTSVIQKNDILIMPRTCSHGGCSKRSGYGVTMHVLRLACQERDDRRQQQKANVLLPRLHQAPVIRRSGDQKVTFFAPNMPRRGWSTLSTRRCMCLHPGCTKQPSFGVAGTKKRKFCAGHAKEGMVNLINKKCAHQGCSKVPSFSLAGTMKRESCAGHAKAGMIDLMRKKRAHPGCTKQPSFGVAGTKKKGFCAGHATEGIVNLKYATDHVYLGQGRRGGPAGSPISTGVPTVPLAVSQTESKTRPMVVTLKVGQSCSSSSSNARVGAEGVAIGAEDFLLEPPRRRRRLPGHHHHRSQDGGSGALLQHSRRCRRPCSPGYSSAAPHRGAGRPSKRKSRSSPASVDENTDDTPPSAGNRAATSPPTGGAPSEPIEPPTTVWWCWRWTNDGKEHPDQQTDDGRPCGGRQQRSR